jgi:hypothetical protein
LSVPNTRSHRGADPRDAAGFGPPSVPALRAAVADLAWLLGRGYAPVSALKLVGDRFNLTERQRQAVRRAACSDELRAQREINRISAEMLAGCVLLIDGFNVLTTIETALGGAVVLLCRDATYRDIAGVHGTYRKVAETLPSLVAVTTVLGKLALSGVTWLFDRPVSNSGRIRSIVQRVAADHSCNWSVDLVDNPDVPLRQSPEIVATADSGILDAGPRWFNLARHVIDSECPGAWVVDLCV